MNQPYIQRVLALGAYVAIATKAVHRLQIRQIVHNQGGIPCHSSNLHPNTCNSMSIVRTETQTYTYTHIHRYVQSCRHAAKDRHRQTHTDGRDQYTFRLAAPNAKCNECVYD